MYHKQFFPCHFNFLFWKLVLWKIPSSWPTEMVNYRQSLVLLLVTALDSNVTVTQNQVANLIFSGSKFSLFRLRQLSACSSQTSGTTDFIDLNFCLKERIVFNRNYLNSCSRLSNNSMHIHCSQLHHTSMYPFHSAARIFDTYSSSHTLTEAWTYTCGHTK